MLICVNVLTGFRSALRFPGLYDADASLKNSYRYCLTQSAGSTMNKSINE